MIRYLLIGIGLSMDAFSLALIYGTLGLEKKKIYLLSIIVGIYHFFMPLLGSFFGDYLLKSIIPSPNILVAVIFLIIAIQMLVSLRKEEEVTFLTNFWSLLLFGFTVSIDSFSVGIGLGVTGESTYITSTMFSLTSAFFTFLGLRLGDLLSRKFGKIANAIGSMVLIFLAISYFFDV